MTEEHRQQPRRRTLKGGEIVFHEGGSSIDCVIRNDSAEGAMLKVASVVGIPDRFILTGDGPPRHCVVVWRRADSLGVHFEGEATL